MPWLQTYDPLHNWALSALLAALPVVVLLGSLAFLHLKAHVAAGIGLAAALLVAVLAFGMPAAKAGAVTLYGAAYGFLPIGWIILNVIFLYTLVNRAGFFIVLQDSLTSITQDRRLQLLLIAFCFGGFFEGAAGFGTPVAVTAAILIGLGFQPLKASGLSLIANTAPVAFGALGTPLIALQGVTGLSLLALSAQTGRLLTFFCLIIPFWLIWAYAGFRAMLQVWPALLVAGVGFALPQLLISNFHGPWLAAVGGALVSMGALVLLLLVWHPKRLYRLEDDAPPEGVVGPIDAEAAAGVAENERGTAIRHGRGRIMLAWLPWVILSIMVFLWGIPQVKAFLDGISVVKIHVSGVDQLINRMPPVVPKPTPEAAVFTLNWLSATGTGIFLAALLAAAALRIRPREVAMAWWATLTRVRFSLLTVSAMMALGFVTRYSGLDAAMGLAFARTGILYPFFGTLLGWLGVALTGSDTSSNVLFGSLQKISANQLGLSPVLMASANSCGGVMGKMIDAQSIVVASTATRWYGHEGSILRYVFLHSITLAALVGLLVLLASYVFPFTGLVVR
jgi:lactate permease